MKNKISKSLCTLSILFPLFMLVGCGHDPEETVQSDISTSSSSSQTTQNNNYNNAVYTDSDPIEVGKLGIEALQPSGRKNENYSLSVSLKITNKDHKPIELVFDNMKVVKESTGAEYTVNSSSSKLTIEAELNKTVTFSSTIPTWILEDNYRLSLNINDFAVTYFLYETPDELRADRQIRYHVDGKLVKTETVKDKRRVDKVFLYETHDNLSYVGLWYVDENETSLFNSSQIIVSDLDLYGKSKSVFETLTTSTDEYSFINGVKHIPSNKALNLPRKIENKEICIGNYAIRDIDVDEIYIPKTVHMIYEGNFTGIGNATIYYEGTEEEWESLFFLKRDSIALRVVFNSLPYGGLRDL